MFTRLMCETMEPFAIFSLNTCSLFNFNTPDIAPLLNNQIDFDLIFVAIMTEAQWFIEPTGLRSSDCLFVKRLFDYLFIVHLPINWSAI